MVKFLKKEKYSYNKKKCSHHRKKILIFGPLWMLTKLSVVIILQYLHISNHYVAHLKLIQC